MKKSISTILVLIAFIAIVCSCKGMNSFSDNYGDFRQDPSAEADFLKFDLKPGYNYYTYGPNDFPDVLFGLKNQYKLEPGIFNPVSLTPGKMKTLVLDMQHRAYANSDILRGFYIIKDDKGDIIGEWYGPFLFRSVVVVRGNDVSIAYPDFPNRPFGRPEPEGDMQ
jgi:hypothetical protein